jgi:predicted LPLAT superfamily acyltransferase
MWRDNLRISRTHARLFFESFLARNRDAHWSRHAERGAGWGLRLVAATQRLFGHQAARLALAPAVAWFYLTGPQARAASRLYLERLGAHAGAAVPRPTPWNVLRHMMSFADAGLDKIAAWRGEVSHDGIEFRGEEEFARLRRAGRGALFIGSHLGNLEMIRALAVTRAIAPITAVVYTDHARRFASTLERAEARFGENLMEVADFGPETAIALRERIERGEILVIVGDRTPPADNGRCASASFLGHAAPFPQGPMVLAHLLDCPVYLFFCLKHGGRYRIHLERFAERVHLPSPGRQAAIEAYVARYAARLEWYCREAPLQWFNFFDFWHEPVGRS